MISKFRRIACVCLTGVMCASLAASQIVALADDKSSANGNSVKYNGVQYENVTGKMDLSAVALKNLNTTVLENAGVSTKIEENTTYTVIVELTQDSILDITEDAQSVSEYMSTFAGSRSLKKIIRSQENFLASLTAKGVGYKFIDNYTTVTNAVALQVNSSDFARISAINGVKTMVLSSTYAAPEPIKTTSIEVTNNPSNVYTTGIYDSEEIIEKYGVDGSGMTVAILDTGLDYTHEAFSTMPDSETLGMTKSDVAELLERTQFDSETLSAGRGVKLTVDDVYVNDKVPFAYDYADHDSEVYPSYSNHGTHVAGIVAGQADYYYDKDGNIAKYEDETPIPFRGVAPNAQLVICKVFTDDFASNELGGATTENVIAALDDCVNLGVDVINMSLGSASGFSSMRIENTELGLYDSEGIWLNDVYDSVKAKGISLICAASNDYSSGAGSAFGTNLASSPDSGTVGQPSTYVGAMSVASINGQLSRYMTVETAEGTKPVYYSDTTNENSVLYNFIDNMLTDGQAKEFKYVVIDGVGEAFNYSTQIQNELKSGTEPVIALISRGKTSFQDKVQLAMDMGARAVIIYNNVAGTIRVSLGDIDNPVPTVSVSVDAGKILVDNAKFNANGVKTGTVRLDENFQAGPFMNDYSSWGTTPDLRIKPDITAHGGEITSTVPGGYDEQSGTSMASPNLAGFVALLRSYLTRQPEYSSYNAVQMTTLVNQVLMSTAVIVYDQELLPTSPRKQGAGLANLDNAFGTNAYLYTVEGAEHGSEDNRPKVELKDDKEKKGEYSIVFYLNNDSDKTLKFNLKSLFMTETLSSDKLSVSEKAYMLDDVAAKWIVNGKEYADGAEVEIGAAAKGVRFELKLALSAEEKNYIDTSFVNGMFVEGFAKLESATQDQCDLSLPFMGFYGDWRSAPMLDYDCYEISDFQQDTSLTDEERPKAQVWATQAFASYYNTRYNVPMGGFAYLQDENADQIYIEEEHASVSRYNYYQGVNDSSNYLTTYKIKALYAGLLRNAEVVNYQLYNEDTGELILSDYTYRVAKARSGGGGAVPGNVELDLDPVELGLVSNGKYRLEFYFYFDSEDVGKQEAVNEDNTFSMTFYVDYEAPILADARLRYYDYKEGNNDRQRVYLDLDVYDNHYAQSVLLCYINENNPEELVLATEYITPVYNAVKNGTTTVSIEVTDFYEKYGDSLYVQVEDYALNHSIYWLRLSTFTSSNVPSDFEIAEGSEITIGVNESYKLNLNYEGTASLSEFTWGTTSSRVRVKNGEIFGVSAGTATVTVSNGSVTKRIRVNIVDKGITLPLPNISFGLIETADEGLKKASGFVSVYPGREYVLEIIPDPWYYPVSQLDIRWTTSAPDIATVVSNDTVDDDGNIVRSGSATVTTYGEKEGGTAGITAIVRENGVDTLYAASVTLNVQDPFRITDFALTSYHGPGGTVVIPDDENIMYIGEEAFKDDLTVEEVIIPATVTEIRERAFMGCTNLKAIYFVSKDSPEDITGVIPTSKCSIINANAFEGCTSLDKVDLTYVKVITLAPYAFFDCSSLKTIKKMSAIGTLNSFAFAGCSSLTEVDITGVHASGSYVFSGCTSLATVTTGYYTAIGDHMFSSFVTYSEDGNGNLIPKPYGACNRLTQITINTPVVSASAFAGCEGLTTVNFGGDITSGYLENFKLDRLSFRIGASAFDGCKELSSVTFNNHAVTSLGDRAFADCGKLRSIKLPDGEISFGDQVFTGTPVQLNVSGALTADEFGAIYSGNTLLVAPSIITADWTFKNGTEAIAPYAFSSSTLSGVTVITVPASVKTIGEGAFAHLNATSVELPSSLKEIADYLFYGCSDLAEIILPDSVVSIGNSAFEGCINLSDITFGGAIENIGDNAFTHCESLVSVILPSSVKVMGNRVFNNCFALNEVKLPALTALGEYTFSGCETLTAVTFAEDAETVGTYTFFPGVSGNSILSSSLVTVILPANVTHIGEGVFAYCNSLVSIDLKNVTSVGAVAFANCRALATVTGLDRLVTIGESAFANCAAIGSLNLANAETVGDNAFDVSGVTGGGYLSLSIPKVKSIGAFAFCGGRIASVEIPASLETFGYGAFTLESNLRSITVSENSKNFTVIDGILYRVFTDASGKTVYELCVYPAARAAESVNIAEGTIAVMSYAFAEINSSTLQTVTIPYSVKTIGVSAFYNSGVKNYVFEGVNAPVLLTDQYDNSEYEDKYINTIGTKYTLFFTNFQTDFITHSNLFSNPVQSEITLTYPSNGTGYDNYVFTRYFGTKTKGNEVLDDTTRGFKDIMDGVIKEHGQDVANVVKGWNSLDVNESNTAKINEFSELIKQAHGLYNNITAETQLELLDSGKESGYYYNLLTSIESELKSVKQKFGIQVTATGLRISADSTHRTEYKAGEKFDMTGLKLTVVYDDYSTAPADMSLVTLDSMYAGELNAYNMYVVVTGYGRRVQVAITVTDDGNIDTPVTPPEESGCGGCASTSFLGGSGGAGLTALVVLGMAMAVTVFVRKKRQH